MIKTQSCSVLTLHLIIHIAPFTMTALATRVPQRVTSPLPLYPPPQKATNEQTTTVPSAPPKRSRINRVNVKTRRVQPIQRDQHGNPILPQQIGVLTVTNLGKIITDREAFHNERYIFPVGYTVQRIYPSMVDPNKNTLITSTIIDSGGNGGPKFHVVAADQSHEPIVANSATGAWTVVVRKSNEIRQRDHSNSASGPDYFGFKHPTIAKMIQDLPGARDLKNYLWQNFEEMEPRAAKGVMAAAEKKRDHLEQMREQQNSTRKIIGEDIIMDQKLKNADKYHHDQEQYHHQQQYHQQQQYQSFYSHHYSSTSSSSSSTTTLSHPYHPIQFIPPHMTAYSNYYHQHPYVSTVQPYLVIGSNDEVNELDANNND